MIFRLRPDNITPLTRTPWGGDWIRKLKVGLKNSPLEKRIGESWEISVAAEYQSVCSDGQLLSAKIEANRQKWLGCTGSFTLLVKLLDAKENLSVQLHPALYDPSLHKSESGKPEIWWIIAAKKNAGIYLGFRNGVTEQDVRRTIERKEALNELMNFEEVESQSCYFISSGTPHAIGAGVSLIEPQIVLPNRSAVTYRIWDWNRLYNAAGKKDPKGKQRILHLNQALKQIDWDKQGVKLVKRAKLQGELKTIGHLTSTIWKNDYFWLNSIVGSGEIKRETNGRFVGLTCIAGSGKLRTENHTLFFRKGESVAISAAVMSFIIETTNVQLLLTSSLITEREKY